MTTNSDGSVTESCPDGSTSTIPAEQSITICEWQPRGCYWLTLTLKADDFIANHYGKTTYGVGTCVEATVAK